MAEIKTVGSNEEITEEQQKVLAEVERQIEAEYGENVPQSILVRGALLQCSCGTHCRRLNLPKDYGVYVNDNVEHPKVHEKNCKVGDDKNISYYGVCRSSTPPESENVCLEPYVWPDGTKTSSEKVDGKRCKPIILGAWFNPVEDEGIFDLDERKNYRGISMKSFLVCKYGGVIEVRESGQNL